MGMHKFTTTAYHLQTDGLVEQFNQTLTDVVAKTVDKSGRDWDRHLPHMLIAYQVSPQESTQEYPFSFCMGKKPPWHSWHSRKPNIKCTLMITRQNWLEVLAKPVCTSQESPAEAEVLWPTCKRVQVSSRRSCICVRALWEEKEGEGTQVFPSISWPCFVPYTLQEYMTCMLECNLMYSQWLNPDLKCTKGTYNLYTHRNLLVYIFTKSRLAWNLTFTPGWMGCAYSEFDVLTHH